MSRRFQHRGGFGLRDLLVAIAAIGFLLGLVVIYLPAGRGPAYRTQCGNNLRQLGLAVHNYHDINGSLPPLYSEVRSSTGEMTSEFAPSWAVFLLPFLEHRAAWENLVITESATNNSVTLPGGSGQTNLRVLSAVRAWTFNCPKRGPREVSRNGVMWQTSDYVPCVHSSFDGAYPSNVKNQTGIIISPMKSATSSTPVVSRTTFGSVTDGLPFTALFGEKHMGSAWLGKPNRDWPVLMFTADERAVRSTGLALAKGSHEAGTAPNADSIAGAAPEIGKFGSWHPEACQFCFGDTSIKRVKNHTSVAILKAMTGRADGIQYDLP